MTGCNIFELHPGRVRPLSHGKSLPERTPHRAGPWKPGPPLSYSTAIQEVSPTLPANISSMCTFIYFALHRELPQAWYDRAREQGLVVKASVIGTPGEPGPSLWIYSLTDGHCSCSLYHRPGFREESLESLTRKYQKKKWSRLKRQRALDDFTQSRGESLFSGVAEKAWCFLRVLPELSPAVALYICWGHDRITAEHFQKEPCISGSFESMDPGTVEKERLYVFTRPGAPPP